MSKLSNLINQLPPELLELAIRPERGLQVLTTGRDLINAIILEAKEEERILHESNLSGNLN